MTIKDKDIFIVDSSEGVQARKEDDKDYIEAMRYNLAQIYQCLEKIKCI